MNGSSAIAVKLLQNGEVDVAILPPIDLYAPSIQTLLRDIDMTRTRLAARAAALQRLNSAA